MPQSISQSKIVSCNSEVARIIFHANWNVSQADLDKYLSSSKKSDDKDEWEKIANKKIKAQFVLDRVIFADFDQRNDNFASCNISGKLYEVLSKELDKLKTEVNEMEQKIREIVDIH